MNHLLRGHAPISDAGWNPARRGGASASDARAGRAQAGRLLGPARMGVLGDQPRPSRAARVGAGQGSDRACSAACCRWSRCGRTSSSRAPSCATPTGAPTTSTSGRSTRPRIRSRWPRTWPCSTAGTARSPGSSRPPRTSHSSSARPTPIRARSRARSSGCCAAASAGPYGLALGREQYRRVVETAEHGGYPLLEHLRKILEGPIVWAPGRGAARSSVSLRGGDFVFESGQDLSIGYDSQEAESCGCIWRRASASTSRRRRPRSR